MSSVMGKEGLIRKNREIIKVDFNALFDRVARDYNNKIPCFRRESIDIRDVSCGYFSALCKVFPLVEWSANKAFANLDLHSMDIELLQGSSFNSIITQLKDVVAYTENTVLARLFFEDIEPFSNSLFFMKRESQYLWGAVKDYFVAIRDYRHYIDFARFLFKDKKSDWKAVSNNLAGFVKVHLEEESLSSREKMYGLK